MTTRGRYRGLQYTIRTAGGDIVAEPAPIWSLANPGDRGELLTRAAQDRAETDRQARNAATLRRMAGRPATAPTPTHRPHPGTPPKWWNRPNPETTK